MTPDADDTALALWTVGAGRAEIRRGSAPAPGPDAVRLRALVSGISRGTEALVFAGKVPESEWARMRCPFQEGDFPFPVKYGYAHGGAGRGRAGGAHRDSASSACIPTRPA